MKHTWVIYFSIVLAIVAFTGCKDPKNTKNGATTNPVFESDPGLKKITEQINNSPKDAELYYNRGKMLRKLKQDSLALKDYKMATTLDTAKAEYFSAVGDLLFEKKDISGSVQWLQKAIRLNPTDRRAHLKIAKLFLYIKDYGKSFAEINIVLREEPFNPEGYFLKGMLYKDMKDTGKAISSFETVLNVAPEYRDAAIQLGLLYSMRKNPIALKYLDNAFKLDSIDVFPIFAKGVFYQNNKDYVNAKAAYKECIIRDHHYVDAYFNTGWILMQQDSFAKAYRQYDLVTKIDPSNPSAYYNRGICSELMDSVKKAIDDYKLALLLDTGYASPKEALKRLKVK